MNLNVYRINPYLSKKETQSNMVSQMDDLPLRERNRQRVTQRIITAAVELFKAKGYHPTTMDDVAQKAEISRGTLFNYFASKEALLLPWALEILDQHIRPQFRTYLETQPTTLECLQFLFTTIADMILASPDVVRAFVQEALTPNANNMQQNDVVGNGIHELYIHIVRYGQARGEVRADIPVENIARYVGTLHLPLIFSLLEPNHPANNSVDLDSLMAFIKTGITPAPSDQG